MHPSDYEFRISERFYRLPSQDPMPAIPSRGEAYGITAAFSVANSARVMTVSSVEETFLPVSYVDTEGSEKMEKPLTPVAAQDSLGLNEVSSEDSDEEELLRSDPDPRVDSGLSPDDDVDEAMNPDRVRPTREIRGGSTLVRWVDCLVRSSENNAQVTLRWPVFSPERLQARKEGRDPEGESSEGTLGLDEVLLHDRRRVDSDPSTDRRSMDEIVHRLSPRVHEERESCLQWVQWTGGTGGDAATTGTTESASRRAGDSDADEVTMEMNQAASSDRAQASPTGEKTASKGKSKGKSSKTNSKSTRKTKTSEVSAGGEGERSPQARGGKAKRGTTQSAESLGMRRVETWKSYLASLQDTLEARDSEASTLSEYQEWERRARRDLLLPSVPSLQLTPSILRFPSSPSVTLITTDPHIPERRETEDSLETSPFPERYSILLGEVDRSEEDLLEPSERRSPEAPQAVPFQDEPPASSVFRHPQRRRRKGVVNLEYRWNLLRDGHGKARTAILKVRTHPALRDQIILGTITDVTALAHNGSRPKKARRV